MNGQHRDFQALETRTAGPWERSAPWMAPLVTAVLLALATFVMYASCGALLI